MFVLLARICQYVLLLTGILFLIWLSTIEILYQNKECFSINIQKSIYQNENISPNASMIDSRLKLNHFTILGTHNSYHRANLIYKYEHQQLDKQLSFGIRQIELDIHLMKNNLVIYHLQLFDDKTHCYCFKDCLMKIVKWTEENRFHYPIYLFIEIKQMFYEDLMTGLTGGVKCEHLQQIKEEILYVFSLDTFILPEQIQGNQTSIRLALKKQRQNEFEGSYTYQNYGWPPVYQSLGKLIPVFLDDVHNRAVHLYSTCDSLQNFFLIAQTNLNLPYSSIICFSSSIKDAEILVNSAMNGQIIRFFLGYENDKIYQTTKQYGIHIISSDCEQCNDRPLCQTLANHFQDSTILCNDYSAPPFCNSSLPFL
jgi:hypothetical protein